jgi:hypothetical protein
VVRELDAVMVGVLETLVEVEKAVLVAKVEFAIAVQHTVSLAVREA